jgi:hypothetical protein
MRHQQPRAVESGKGPFAIFEDEERFIFKNFSGTVVLAAPETFNQLRRMKIPLNPHPIG